MSSVLDARRDRLVLYAAALVRAVATSFAGVTIGVFLGKLGLGAATVGLVVTSGLAGAAAAAVVATFAGDRLGRRTALIAIAICTALGTALFALSSHPVLLAACAFLGGVNGMGRDRGAALVLEQAALPATTSHAERTRTIAVYTMLQDIGHALGSLAAALPAIAAVRGHDELLTMRAGFGMCAAVALVAAIAYARLGPSLDAPSAKRAPMTPHTRSILVRISALFGIDSIGGGFLTTAMLSYFFFERFGASQAAIGLLFFGARVMNAGSHLAAAWLARRIGLVNTMVLTHLPSSLLLVTVAFAPNFAVAAALFLIREGLVEMDVPTRQSYVLAVVAPEERTLASGVTNLVRLAGWAIAPAFAGALVQGTSLFVPLVVGATLKIAYDLLLWLAFRRIKPPEETLDH